MIIYRIKIKLRKYFNICIKRFDYFHSVSAFQFFQRRFMNRRFMDACLSLIYIHLFSFFFFLALLCHIQSIKLIRLFFPQHDIDPFRPIQFSGLFFFIELSYRNQFYNKELNQNYFQRDRILIIATLIYVKIDIFSQIRNTIFFLQRAICIKLISITTLSVLEYSSYIL